MYQFFANLTLIVHLFFILFVVFGGLIFFIFPKIIYLHLPALLWGVYIELTNSVCPLTYLENWSLNKGELTTYSNDFILNYLFPIIYPEGLTNEIQIYLGISLIVTNILIYGFIYKNFMRK
tara:strand:- start:43 stop:405 length:363 start_codon:yes stop_codon:yes gene_type:complete